MKLRLLAAPAVLSVLALSATTAVAHEGHANKRAQVKDVAGDALDKQGMHDIVGVTFGVTKTVTKTTKVVRGKRVTTTTSTPKDFVVTLDLDGDPLVTPGVTYYIGVDTPCGALHFQTRFSTIEAGEGTSAYFMECGPEDLTVPSVPLYTYYLEPTVTKGEHKITYTVPFRAMPKQIKVGSMFGDPFAFTAATDPVFGFDTVTFGDKSTAIDYASGGSFKLS